VHEVADPLRIFFAADSFRNVSVPVQLWGSERGGDGVAPESVRDIAGWLTNEARFSRPTQFPICCSLHCASAIEVDATGALLRSKTPTQIETFQ
jgi:hypothetical protein